MADPIAGSPVYPGGSRVNERGHLEIAGCDVVELAEEFGTPAYVYAEDDMRARARAYRDGLRAARRRLRGALRQQVAALHRRLPALRRGGALGRRRLRRRAAHGAARRLRPGPHPHARQQQERRGDPLRRALRRRPPDPRLLRRDRALRAAARRSPRTCSIRVTPGDQALDPRLRADRPARLEVRLRARGRPGGAGDRAGARLRRAQPDRPARPHRLADLRARALHAGDPRARRAGRRLVPDRQRRRRPRHRLHGRGRAALDRRLRRRQGARRRRGLRRRACGS